MNHNPQQAKSTQRGRLYAAIAVLAIIALVLTLDLGSLLSLDSLRQWQDRLLGLFDESPVLTSIVFLVAYTAATAVSIPGALIFTLAGGAIFGLVWGTVLVSVASTAGATLAFLIARFVMGETFRLRFNERFQSISRGFEKDGAFYLLTLRLVPAFPFFLVNILMGLTTIRTLTYMVVSQIGMLPATVVYVNAGTELARIRSLDGILTPRILISLVLLGILPLVSRLLLRWLKSIRERTA